MVSLLVSGGAFAQHLSSTVDALNGQLYASDGFELKYNLDPFMDMKLWDKETNGNQITFKNTNSIETDGGGTINAKNYKIELNYEDINTKKKKLNSMYSSREWTEANSSAPHRDQSITKLKDNKIIEVTGCMANAGGGDTNKLGCSTTSKMLCDFIAKRSEKFFRTKADAKKCSAYVSNLLADLAREQKGLVADLDKVHKANVAELKAKGVAGDNYEEEDNGLIGYLKMKPVEAEQANLMERISMYQAACSTYKMNEKEAGKTRSFKDQPTTAPVDTQED